MSNEEITDEIEGVLETETGQAILFHTKDENGNVAARLWIPRSLIKYLWRKNNMRPTECRIKVPVWYADKNNL